jgi:hypothetical protein
MSRVYAASTLPADMVVPGLLPDGSRCSGLMLPLGRIATEALRFRWVGAEGWGEGWADAGCVYAAFTLPADMVVPGTPAPVCCRMGCAVPS